jgi:DHA2 family multidrug resistance protein
LQSGLIGQFWNPASAAGAAALDGEVTRQATIIAYENDYKLLMVLTLAVMPLALLIRPASTAMVTLPRAAEP